MNFANLKNVNILQFSKLSEHADSTVIIIIIIIIITFDNKNLR